MKILFFIDSLGSGGAQSQFVSLSILFKNLGFEVAFYTYYEDNFFSGILEKKNIECIYTKKNGRLGINVILQYAKFLAMARPDIVISQLTTPNFYTAIGRALSPWKPKLLIIHGSTTDFNQISIGKKAVLYVMNHLSDLVVCNSHHERANMQKRHSSISNRIHTIYNTVNFERFVFAERPEKRNRILVVASVSIYKNGLDVIEAVNRLKKRGRVNFTLTWIGRKEYFVKETDSYYSRMVAKIEEYGLGDIWEWKEPTLHIEAEYPLFDCLLLASSVEGLPNVVCEAMACGLPVLISNTLDHPLLVEHRVNGLLFEVNNPESLAATLDEFTQLSLPEIQKMGHNSFKMAKKLFDKKVLMEQYIQLLNIGQPVEAEQTIHHNTNH